MVLDYVYFMNNKTFWSMNGMKKKKKKLIIDQLYVVVNIFKGKLKEK